MCLRCRIRLYSSDKELIQTKRNPLVPESGYFGICAEQQTLVNLVTQTNCSDSKQAKIGLLYVENETLHTIQFPL